MTDKTLLLNHFVFPRKIDPLDNSYENSLFISHFARGLKQFQTSQLFNILPETKCEQLVNIFNRWLNYQNDELRCKCLTRAVHHLKSPGDYLPIIFSSQNALLSLRLPKDAVSNSDLLVNATQIRLSSNVLYDSESDTKCPLRNMPDGPTFKVAPSKLSSPLIIEKMTELSRHLFPLPQHKIFII